MLIEGTTVTVEGIPVSEAIQNVPGRASTASYEILFLAKDVPPLGFKSYYLTASNDMDETVAQKLEPTKVRN